MDLGVVPACGMLGLALFVLPAAGYERLVGGTGWMAPLYCALGLAAALWGRVRQHDAVASSPSSLCSPRTSRRAASAP